MDVFGTGGRNDCQEDQIYQGHSVNSINFAFPYSGEQFPILTLRRHPRYGDNIILSIDRGQFICRIEGCHVLVRFDNANPQSFAACEPSDHSTTYVFIEGCKRFVAALKKSKTLRMEAEFYQEGPREIEFRVQGFDEAKL